MQQRCQEYAEGQLFGPYANGAKSNLINNYRGAYQPWADRHEVDHTTMGKPMPLLGGTTPLLEDDGIQADNQGYASYPMRLGHEWAGTVASVGNGVDTAWVGRRVMGDTMLGDGVCRQCREGH
jgi:hypothetical protein